jgi:hypothetical protein
LTDRQSQCDFDFDSEESEKAKDLYVLKGIHLPLQHAATDGWRKEKNPIPQIIGAAEEMQKKESKRTSRTTTGRAFSSNLTSPGMSAAALRGKTEEQQQPQTHLVAVAGPCGPTPTRTSDNKSVSSGH